MKSGDNLDSCESSDMNFLDELEKVRAQKNKKKLENNTKGLPK
jgi:hypothetical protein